MKNVIAHLKTQKLLKAAKKDMASLTHHGFDKFKNTALRDVVMEFMDNETPLDFYWSEAGTATTKDRPNHHTNPFGILRSVVERLVMIPALAPHIDDMSRHDGTVDALALDVALAATLISDTHHRGLLGILRKGCHTEGAAYAWEKFHPKTHPSVTQKVIAVRVADAVLWHHGGKDLTSRKPLHIRPEMLLTSLVNAFCLSKEIDSLYHPRIVILK